MKGKYLVLAAILGGLTLFVWGFIWHGLLPFYEKSAMFEFTDGQTVNTVIQQNASHGNAIYYSKEGAFVAVSFTPEMADKTKAMGAPMTLEFITNMIVSLLFAVIIARTGAFGSVMKGALFMGLAGLTAELSSELSYWNWYGFSGLFTTLNIIGETLSWYIAGLVISGLHLKFNK